MSGVVDEERAIEAFGSLSQSTRLAVVRHLIAVQPGSVSAGDLAKHCGIPHNTMSTHLSVLTRSGLITAERLGRSMNYRIDLEGFRSLVTFLAKDCCHGQPELCADVLQPRKMETPRPDFLTPAFNVLFLCTHNSARSIMAEALLSKVGQGRFNAYSAGSDPARKPLPDVVDRLQQMGHDVSGLRCKSWNEFTGQNSPRMDFVIALCDTLDGQVCPDFGEKFVTGAWPLPDPKKFMGSATERATLLNELYAMVRRRIEIFCSLPFATLDRMAVKARLDEIGASSWKTN